MRNSLELLEHVVDTQALQVIQDDLAAVTDMAVLTVDAAGKPVTRHSKCTDFCRAMRSATQSSRMCESCDYRGGHAAQSMQRPYVYKCHMGIVDMAVPLVVGSKYLGSIMLGQISIPGQGTGRELDVLNASGSPDQREHDSLLEEYYRSLPVMSYERIESVASLVTHMSHYITGRIGGAGRTYVYGSTAVKRTEADGQVPGSGRQQVPGIAVQQVPGIAGQQVPGIAGQQVPDIAGQQVPDIAGQQVPNITGQQVSDMPGQQARGVQHVNRTQRAQNTVNQAAANASGSIRLKPALEHIHVHFRERLRVAEMAELCWIGADYFSRLFKQETGRNFSSYINGLRLDEAKRCLVQGEQSVVSIAYSLGYEDSGYFIRTFKKATGETPAAYRRKHR